MLTKPTLPRGIDGRLRSLADPDFERRVKGCNPQFFGDAPLEASAQATPPNVALRVGLLVLCCALVAGVFMGLWARGQRSHAPAALKSMMVKHAPVWRTTRPASRHSFPVRSRSIITTNAQKVASWPTTRTHVQVPMQSVRGSGAMPSSLSHPRHALTTAPQLKPAVRPLQATVNAMVEQQAEAMEAMRAQQSADAASSSNVSTDASSAADQRYPGRQISTGSIWSDAAPGSGVGTGGTVPIMVGRGPMGGGGSCRRGH